MKKYFQGKRKWGWAFFICMLTQINLCQAQKNWQEVSSREDVSRDSITKNGFTLIFVNKDSSFVQRTKQRMMETFFEIYPKEVKTFNPHALHKVFLIIDPQYHGVAATAGGIIRVNPKWMHDHSEDLDVVTHEAMHVVQNYSFGKVPGWITEGIADYARYRFGVNNLAGGWSMPDYHPTQSYQNAYRITARFFVWIEKHYDQHMVVKLDKLMRSGQYTDDFWLKETKLTVDQLWKLYGENPAI